MRRQKREASVDLGAFEVGGDYWLTAESFRLDMVYSGPVQGEQGAYRFRIKHYKGNEVWIDNTHCDWEMALNALMSLRTRDSDKCPPPDDIVLICTVWADGKCSLFGERAMGLTSTVNKVGLIATNQTIQKL